MFQNYVINANNELRKVAAKPSKRTKNETFVSKPSKYKYGVLFIATRGLHNVSVSGHDR